MNKKLNCDSALFCNLNYTLAVTLTFIPDIILQESDFTFSNMVGITFMDEFFMSCN